MCKLNEGSGDAIFNCNGMGILNIDLNNINLDDNVNEGDLDNIILIRLLAWHIKFEKCKERKKELSEELMPVAQHPNRWWDWCMSEDEKKEIDPMFIENCKSMCRYGCVWLIQISVLSLFGIAIGAVKQQKHEQ